MTDARAPATDERPPKPRPAPVPDHDSAPYWQALHDGRLLLQRCQDCGEVPALSTRPLPVLPGAGDLAGGERSGHRLQLHGHPPELRPALSRLDPLCRRPGRLWRKAHG